MDEWKKEELWRDIGNYSGMEAIYGQKEEGGI